jgi:hypothetical protein
MHRFHQYIHTTWILGWGFLFYTHLIFLIAFVSGRFVHRSSSRTLDTVERFQRIFGLFEDTFISAISTGTFRANNHLEMGVLKDDLSNVRGALDDLAFEGTTCPFPPITLKALFHA